ncbi:hypothetical protein I7X12_00005 [Halosimplex litoreum]|uniref:AI-2E family transporter n=1 Tax=Halosimplex litoreum TaxID=1198301 RepID=A0A7T3KVJ0_9EURY|nr:hypothetical protein [Halosimplex litoreum]QPV63058.1 hypothetical protein I7X12_00005 [Halosimplex litoreum]
MSGFNEEDRIPMVAAIVVVVVSNVVGYSLGVVIYMSILAAPIAVVAFMIVRRALYGSALPDVLASDA